MYKLFYRRRDSGPRCREEISVLDTYNLLQKTEDSLFIESIFHTEHHRRGKPIHQISDIMFLTYRKRVKHQALLQSRSLIDLLQNARIHLLPKTGNTAHGRRTHFLDCLLDILRTKIYTQQTAPIDTEISPRTFENMCKRQEIHNYVRFIKSDQTPSIGLKCRLIAGMM